MSINVKQSIIVRPCKSTIPKQRIWLSSLDLVIHITYQHSTAIYVYGPTENETNSSKNFFNTEILTDALSRLLVSYYPMAGRLKRNENDGGRLEIDCNDEGVLFVEVETTFSLADFGDFKPNSELKNLLIPKCDYSKGISTFPIAMVQLTRFKCGGVSLGLALHHHVADGVAYVQFFNSWSRIARGLDIEGDMPIHDRRPYLSPRDPPLVKFQHFFPRRGLLGDSELIEHLETTTTKVAIFKFSKDQISTLKQKAATEQISCHPTTYGVLSAHIWRSVCKARGLNDDQETKLYIPTDGRRRLKEPKLPSGFCGNAIFYPSCIMKAGEVVNNTLGFIVTKINETLSQMDDEEYLRSNVDYFETHPNMRSLVFEGFRARYPNISINYWGKGMPLDKADFGWGKPLFTGHGGIGCEGQSYITPNENGEAGFLLSINLFTHHMDLFTQYVYDIAG